MSPVRIRHGDHTGYAVRNTGTWGPIIQFLTEIGKVSIPFGSVPPVIRRPDGSLEITGPAERKRVDIGGWLLWIGGGFQSYAAGGDLRDEYEILEGS